jgi:hypothetical protein
MIEYRLKHIMSYTAKLSEPEMMSPVPEGIRVNIYVTGGASRSGLADDPEGRNRDN